MADRFNIKFTIQAVDRFSANMKKLEEKLDSVQRKAEKLDMNREVQVNADIDAALRNLNRLQAEVASIDRSSRKPKKIKIATADAQASLARITKTIQGIGDKRVDIDINTRQAFTQLRRVDNFFEDIRRKNTEIKTKIDVDTGGATRSLNRISDIVTGLGDKRLKIETDNSEAIRSLNRVDEVINDIRRKNTEIRLSADLDMSKIPSTLQRVARMTDATMNARDNYKLGYDTMPATRALRQLNALADEVTNEDRQIDIGVDMAGAIAQMQGLRAASEAILRLDADVDVNTAGALAHIMSFRAIAQANPIVIKVTAEVNRIRNQISNVATLSRNAGEAILFQFSSMALAFSTSIVPILATTMANLAHVAVMAGTAGGAALGLGTAFVAAGAGAAGFAAVAIPSITGVFDRMGELQSISDKIELAKLKGDAKKANELIAQGHALMEGMTQAQLDAHFALRAFKDEYAGLVSSMESGVLTAFAGGLQAVTSIMQMGEPLIRASVDAVNRLMDALNRNLESQDVKDFFTFLNNNAASSLEVITKSLGNFMVGLLSIFEAFGPLSVDMQGGFLRMSESFRAWAASLSESQGFQNFVNYIRENWPKIKQIFGDGIVGMTQMLASFGPSASSFMDRLVDMMNRFREWSSTLESNQGFQKFIDYVAVNGPRVASLFSQIIQTLVSLGVALEPIGAVALQAATKLFEFFTAINENYPIIPQLIAGFFSLVGAFSALLLPFGFLRMAFNLLWPVVRAGFGLLMNLGSIFGTVGGAIARFIPWIIQIGSRLLILAGPIGIAIALIVGIATAIYMNWGTIGPWVTALWSRISTAVSNAWSMISTVVSSALSFVAGIVMSGLSAVGNAIVSFATGAVNRWNHFWNGLWEMVTYVFPLIGNAVLSGLRAIGSGIASWFGSVKASFSSGWNAIKSGTSAFISSVVSGFNSFRSGVMSAVNNIVSGAVSAWNNMRSRMSSAMSSLRSAITSAWNSIRSGVTSAVNSIRSAAVNAFNNIRSAITSAVNSIRSAVTSAFNSMRSAISNAINSARSAVTSGFSAMRSAASSAVSNIISAIRNGFNNAVSAIRSAMSSARSAVTSGMNSVLSYLRGINLASIGRNMIAGLASGIRSMAGSVVSAAKGVVSGAVNAAKSLLKIHSPSRVFRDIGAYVGSGFVKGIKGTSKDVSAAGAKMAGLFKQVVQSKLSSRNQKIIFAGLANWGGRQIDALEVIAKKRETVAAKLKDAGKKLEDAMKVRNDYAKSVTDATMGYGSIKNAEGTTAYDIAESMRKRLQDIKVFQANVQRLAKAGLNKTTLMDIVNAGVEGGGATAAALASDTGMIKAINGSQSGINAVSKSLGNYTADRFYGVGVNAAKGLVKGLQAQEAALKKQADHIAYILTRAIKTQLKVKSPSRVFKSIGMFVMDGLRIGIESETTRTVRAVERVAGAMTNAFNPELEAAVANNAYANAGAQYSTARKEKAEAAQTRTVVEVPVYLNGREIAKASNAEQKRMNARENARLAKFKNGGGA